MYDIWLPHHRDILRNEFWINFEDMIEVDNIRKLDFRLPTFNSINYENASYNTKTNFTDLENKAGIISSNSQGERKITVTTIRPQLIIPNEIKKDIQLTINPLLPKNELLDYLSKVLDDLQTHRYKVQSIDELLHNHSLYDDEASKKQKAQKWADRFFTYDYITQRKKYINEYNSEQEKIRDEEIERIENNPTLSNNDKTIQKAEEKRTYQENIIDTKLTDIFKEYYLLKQLNKKASTTKTDYYFMQRLIEELEYKNLIANTSDNPTKHIKEKLEEEIKEKEIKEKKLKKEKLPTPPQPTT